MTLSSVDSRGGGVRAPGAPEGKARGYRPELQGLRALAVLLVVIYHVWLGRVSGGVDVFFLISGFLITGQLVRARARGGIAFRPLWGRMIKRLLPGALTVLAACMALSVALLPENRWFQTIREIVASAFQVQNWQLAAASADYFAQHDEASVVQHFWSLSVQVQFYVVWPLLVGLVAFVASRARRFRMSLPAALGVTIGVVFAVSLAYSVWLTAVNQPLAYFSSLTRVWEFALGGLLALTLNMIAPPRWARVLLGWVGVLGLVACGLVLQVGTVFPGYAALWPTLCAVAVLVAGVTGSRLGVDRILASRPLEYVGNISYALYLWHWPILVLYLVHTERTDPGLAGGCAVIAISLLLAVLTYHLVEVPVRNSKIDVATTWGAYRFAAVSLAALLVAASAWQLVSWNKAKAYALSVDDPDHPGAQAMLPDFEYWGAEDPPLVPAFVAVSNDWATTEGLDCEMSPRGAGLEVCISPTAEPPTRRIAVVGDSHPTQFLAALRPIAAQRNWQLIVMSRGACPFSTQSEIRPDDQSCRDWNDAVFDELLSQRPDFVFTAATRDVRVGLTEHTPAGYIEQWRKLDREAIPVLAVRDNPRFDFAPSACVEQKGKDAPECSTPRAQLLSPRPPYADLSDIPPNVLFLDFSDYYCDQEICPPVIGNVLVYMDDNHVGATYLSTMASIVEQAIDRAIDEYTARFSPS